MENGSKQSSIINKLSYYYNKIKNMDQNSMSTYFFLVSFLVAVTLYSASISPSPNYHQIHIFIFIVVAYLISSIFFMHFRKSSRMAVIFFALYAIFTLYVIAVGVWTYVIIPLGFT